MISTAHQTALVARIAWLATFVVPLALAGGLLAVKTAHSQTPASGPAHLAFEADEEDATFEGEECLVAEEEWEAGTIGEAELEAICAEGTEPAEPAAARCPIRSANAHASLRGKQLKLTIGYTAARPTAAMIEVRSGNKRLATVHRRLGRSGVVRIVRKVGKQRPNRVTVSLKAANCSRSHTRSTKVR